MNNAEVLIKFKGDTKDLDKSTSKAESTLKGFSSKIGSAFKVAGAAVAATTAAVGALVKQSVEGYAEFEQLEGGLISLFGEGSAEMQRILKQSEQAYKDLTMSQNDYLTNFQSSYPLVNAGLSENADSIEYTNKMLQLSSDLFNTYGGSIEGYQNAINWALKGSFVYLDNLNLGIKGTQEGFIEAANASGVLGRTIQSVSEVTSDEIIDVIQHYAEEYGVWGKTAQEAGDTILGSLNMVKATWSNFLTGLSKDGADIDKLIDQLINAAITFAGNIIPVIERALVGIVNALPTIISNIISRLPNLINTILPPLMEAVMDVLFAIIKAIPEILPVLIQQTLNLINMLAQQMPELIPTLVAAVLDGILSILDNIDLLIDCGIQLIIGMAIGLVKAIPEIVKRLPQIIAAIVVGLIQGLGQIMDVGKNLVRGLWTGIKAMKDWVLGKIKSFGKSILKGLRDILGIGSPSKETAWMAEMMGLGMTKELDKIAPEIQKTIDSTFTFNPTMANTSSLNMSKNITVYNNVDVKQDALGQMVSDIKTFSGGAKNDYNYGMS